MLKIEKIEEKEDVKVIAQKDYSNKNNPNGFIKGCKEDCMANNLYPWYGSPDY